MRTIFKKMIVLTMVVLMALVVSGNAYAMSFKFDVYSDKMQVRPSETLNLEMRILEVDAGELGINVIEAVLEYDENIFETVSKESFKMRNGWTISINKEKMGTYKLLMSKAVVGVKEIESLGTVELKVKAGVTPQDTYVKFGSIETNDGEELITGSDVNLSFKIIEAPVDNGTNGGDNGSGGDNGGNGGSNGSATTNNGSSNSGSQGTTYYAQSSGKSSGTSGNQVKNSSTIGSSNTTNNPKTGDNIMIVVGILVLAVVGIVAIAVIKKKINTKE